MSSETSLSIKIGMRKKNKTISDSIQCLEESTVSGNVIKNCKILGALSKNNRVYPPEVMRKSLAKYDGLVVNLNHRPNSPRDVQEVFGRIVNPRFVNNAIYADLEYNPSHQWADAFKWFAMNQPEVVGFSHSAIARTRMANDGVEYIEELTEVSSADLVADPATCPNGLFEEYNRILESQMNKDTEERCWKGYKPTPGVEPYAPGSCTKQGVEEPADEMCHEKDKKEKIAEDFLATKFESMEAMRKGLEEAIHAILHSDDDPEKKKNSLMEIFGTKSEALMDKPEKDMDEEKKDGCETHPEKPKQVTTESVNLTESVDDDDVTKKQKAEKAIRESTQLGMKLLLEELDAFRTKAEAEKTVAKVKKYCSDAGLSEKLVTEAFVDVLTSVPETKWSKLVEDRKNITLNTKNPISYGSDTTSSATALTVDSLVKQLRS